MRLIKTHNAGQLVKKEIEYLGGEYSNLEKIRLGGVGSPKVIYDYGLAELDILSRNIKGEVTYISFELLRKGLVLRANCNQRQIFLGLKMNEIKSIDLVGRRVPRDTNHELFNSKEIRHQGIMRIRSMDLTMIKLDIQTQQYEAIVKFFFTPPFENKFHYSIEL